MKSSRVGLLLVIGTAVTTALTAGVRAEIKLPALISDHMVLQQEKPANVWGWAAPGEKITVKLGGKTATTAAGADGKWAIKFGELKPGAAGEMTISGKNTLTVKDVAVGETHACAIASDGVWCWGDNSQQQIGPPGTGQHPPELFTY